MAYQTQKKYDPSQPMNNYLNIPILNNDQGNNTISKNLEINETRDGDFLSSASNYYLSVSRFQLQSQSIPQFIPELELNQTNPDLTIYKYWFVQEDEISPQYSFIHVPQNQEADIPISPTTGFTTQDIDGHYYDITNLQHFFHYLNKQIQDNYTAWGKGLSATAPVFKITPQTGIVSVEAPKEFYNYDINSPELYNTFHVNQAFYNILAPLPWIKEKTPAYKGGRVLAFPDYQDSPTIDPIITTAHSSIKQLFNPIVEISFKTGLFPVVPAESTPPLTFGAIKKLDDSGVRRDLDPIITDFIVAVSQDNQYSPLITYEPSAEYRLIDLIGNSGLKKIEISIFWVDKFGGRHPFQIEAGAWGTIKMLFRRKDFYSYSLGL